MPSFLETPEPSLGLCSGSSGPNGDKPASLLSNREALVFTAPAQLLPLSSFTVSRMAAFHG